MAKRLSDTEIWEEDWFLDMPSDYKLLWFYMLSSCDHAGLFRVNMNKFCRLNGIKIDSKTALSYFNSGKIRINEISSSTWYIEDFFVFQYGETLNENNRVHVSVRDVLNRINIKLEQIRGLKYFVKKGDKPENRIALKSTSYGFDPNLTPTTPQKEPKETPKRVQSGDTYTVKDKDSVFTKTLTNPNTLTNQSFLLLLREKHQNGKLADAIKITLEAAAAEKGFPEDFDLDSETLKIKKKLVSDEVKKPVDYINAWLNNFIPPKKQGANDEQQTKTNGSGKTGYVDFKHERSKKFFGMGRKANEGETDSSRD